MSELPTPVSESTAIEIVRKEGTARSFKSVGALVAGELLYFANSSGVTQIVGGTSGGISAFAGIALYTQTSGNRVTTIRGKVRCRWDGATAGPLGASIAGSTTRSGWFEVTSGIAASGQSYLVLGQYIDTGVGTLATANSGTLVAVEI